MDMFRKRRNGFSRVSVPGIPLLVALLLLPYTSPVHSTTRTALVIGNANYAELPLKNPVNDARAMTSVLTESGFEVITVLDADLRSMQDAMLKFAESIDSESTALVFYAGHGVQANGHNYLLPVDAQIESESELRFEGLELGDLLDELDKAGARVNIVILDACRNNPFERKLRGRGRGLAAVDAARGTIIAYATAPGSTAADGQGENGLYTGSLLKAIRKPNLKVEEVFKEVRIAVAEASGGAQIPWESSSLTGDFVFVSDAATKASTNTQISAPQSKPSNTAEMSSCDDLSGSWAHSNNGPARCPPPIFTFTRTGSDIYDVDGSGCLVPMAGTAKRTGQKVLIKWAMFPCTGETELTMDAQCQSGTGPLRINPTLMCLESENTSSIQRTRR